MKDWIQRNYGPGDMELERLRIIVQQAWDAVPEEYLESLLNSMHNRCREVIDRHGYATSY